MNRPDTALPNPDHTLFRKGSGQCCGQAKENGQDSRYVEAHVKHFDTAFRGFFQFVRGLCTLFRPP
jgi:hypothetical protein